MTISVQVPQRSKLSAQVIIQTPNKSARKPKTLKTERSYGISEKKITKCWKTGTFNYKYLLFLTIHLSKNIKCLRKQMLADRIRGVIT